jgi:hydrogenase small subunit
MRDRVVALARNAAAAVAIGSCASYGGSHAAQPNPTGCRGVADVLDEAGVDTPVVNVPGCPPHPDWFTGTVVDILLHGLPDADAVDAAGRPLRFFGRLIHDLCERRADFEAHKFAKAPGEPGCLYELGCKGPFTHADCPERQFDQGMSWCVKAGGPCQGCTEPTFPDVQCPLYRKIPYEAQPRIVRDPQSGRLVAVTKPSLDRGE